MRYVVGIVATLWLAGASPAGADSDVGLWLELGGDRELHDRVELGISQEVRFDQDISRVSAVLPQISLAVELIDFFEVSAGYRYEYERDDDGDFEHGHRGNIDGELSWDIGMVETQYRLRLQQDIASRDKRRVRYRVQAKLDLDRSWEPGAEVEIFHDVDGGERGLQKTRFTFGVEVEWWDQDLQTFYRLDVPKDSMDPILHIVGLELSTEL